MQQPEWLPPFRLLASCRRLLIEPAYSLVVLRNQGCIPSRIPVGKSPPANRRRWLSPGPVPSRRPVAGACAGPRVLPPGLTPPKRSTAYRQVCGSRWTG